MVGFDRVRMMSHAMHWLRGIASPSQRRWALRVAPNSEQVGTVPMERYLARCWSRRLRVSCWTFCRRTASWRLCWCKSGSQVAAIADTDRIGWKHVRLVLVHQQAFRPRVLMVLN